MCSLQEHIEREIRARQAAEDATRDTPNSGELLGTSVKIDI